MGRKRGGEIHNILGHTHSDPPPPTRLHLLTSHPAVNPVVDYSIVTHDPGSHTQDPVTSQKPCQEHMGLLGDIGIQTITTEQDRIRYTTFCSSSTSIQDN